MIPQVNIALTSSRLNSFFPAQLAFRFSNKIRQHISNTRHAVQDCDRRKPKERHYRSRQLINTSEKTARQFVSRMMLNHEEGPCIVQGPSPLLFVTRYTSDPPVWHYTRFTRNLATTSPTGENESAYIRAYP